MVGVNCGGTWPLVHPEPGVVSSLSSSPFFLVVVVKAAAFFLSP